jgi:glyoxylase-like metal-dependent hydrolase (beta-lactamase superfamily II)
VTELPVRTIRLPTPFAVGTVNVHRVGDPPFTLVDVGPDYPPALAALEEALLSGGHGWHDVGRVLITHHHVDHVGLAHVVKERSGAEIVAHSSLVDVLPNLLESMALDEAYASELMLAWGLPPDRVRDAGRLMAGHRRYAHPVAVDRVVDDGDTVDGLRVSHRPGHSESDVVVHDDDRRVAFVGDHLLARISSNALVHRPLGGGPERAVPRALVVYRGSLERSLSDLPDVVHAGHGPPIADSHSLIRERLAEQDRRTDAVLLAIQEGDATVERLIERIWPRLDRAQLFLATSEVLGHVGRLIEQGRAEADQGRRLTAG